MSATLPDPVTENLRIIDQHIREEAGNPDAVMPLYTDDIVLEVPGRGLRFEGRAAIRANYIAMFASMGRVEIEPLERFATAERAVDDMIVRFRLIGSGFSNAPFPVGSRVEVRLLHVFAMRDGKIARETVFEAWKRLD